MMSAEFEIHLRQLCADRQTFLSALSDFLDGLNPDRRQIELGYHRAAIVTALHELRALNPAQASAAWAFFPELRLADDLPCRSSRVKQEPDAFFVTDFLSQTSFPLFDPNIAQLARSARGTPAAARRFALACSQGADALPHLVAVRAGEPRFGFRHQGQ